MLGGASLDLSNAYLRVAVGRKIFESRKAKQRTRREVAKFVGVSRQEMDEYEKGRSGVSVETLLRILRFLDIPPQDFFASIWTSHEGCEAHAKK